MTKIEQAQEILRALGLPGAQQNQMAGLTLLALAGIGPKRPWGNATKQSLTVTKGIMEFIRKNYKKVYAPNTRETFRRQVLHQFVQAGLLDYNPDDPDLPTNSPRAHYALTPAALAAIRAYGTPAWREAPTRFVSGRGRLLDLYSGKRSMNLVPVHLPDGKVLHLSPGKHNKLQAAIVSHFAPRFAPGGMILYLGDTANKILVLARQQLLELRICITEHDKLPDVVLWVPARNRVFLVEAVTAHGPMTPKRVAELRRAWSGTSASLVFLSAFPDFASFRKHIDEIAWETEVWIAEIPDHLIHYNGDKFLEQK